MADREQILSDTERAYFSNFEELFGSSAWQELSHEWHEDLERIPLDAFWKAQSWEEILAARALVTKLREYLSYPTEFGLRKENRILELEQEAEDQRDADRPDV